MGIAEPVQRVELFAAALPLTLRPGQAASLESPAWEVHPERVEVELTDRLTGRHVEPGDAVEVITRISRSSVMVAIINSRPGAIYISRISTVGRRRVLE